MQTSTPDETAIKQKNGFDAQRHAAMQACVKHSRALLDSAKAVQTTGHPNIAYHLATLALEEIGRKELIAVQGIASAREIPPAWAQKHTQDHVKKLFWCFFGGMFLSEQLTKEHFEGIEKLAKQIHSTRLAGLYVESTEDGLSVPADQITDAEASEHIAHATAWVSFAEAAKLRENVPQEDIDLQSWFLTANDDPEKQRLILGSKSLAKLAEFGDAKAWMLWLKQQFDDADADCRAAAAAELQRSRALPTEGFKEKWKIRIKIFSGSHSIRPKELADWNKTIDPIKLSTNQKKDQLFIDICLLDNVPVEALWYFSWGVARHFVTALNIATQGFWWWRLPEQVSKFYETMEDVQTHHRLAIERQPVLKMDWGQNRVLTKNDLGLVSQCMVALPQPEERDKQEPYGYYLSGINFLSVNDVHWQCEGIAFGNFFQSLRGMMRQSGYWQPDTPFVPVALKFLEEAFPNTDDRLRLVELFEMFETQKVDNTKVNLKDAAIMKIICDAFFLSNIRPSAIKLRMDTKKNQLAETVA